MAQEATASKALPSSMLVVNAVEPGGVNVMRLVRVPVPPAAPGHVLLKVHAAGVNRPDILQRKGLYILPQDANPIMGLEVCGTVVVTGANVDPKLLGHDFMALTNGGGYAQYVSVPVGQCMPVPSGLTQIEAASLPESYVTAWHNIFGRGSLKPGHVVLVHGGASGVGSAAIQMVKYHGARVVASIRTKTKAQFCANLGANLVVSTEDHSWTTQVLDYTRGEGVHNVLDILGGTYLDANLEVLANGGTISLIAYLTGRRSYLNIAEVMAKDANIGGSQIRLLSPRYKAILCTQVSQNVVSGFAANAYKPVVHSVFPLDKVQEAHELMESGNFTGKIVLSLE